MNCWNISGNWQFSRHENTIADNKTKKWIEPYDMTLKAYSLIKNDIDSVSNDIVSLFSVAKTIPGLAEGAFNKWEKTCTSIRQQIAAETINIAVAGPIKSGKSTFVNSLFQGDYLKRGAGVVTSIVTRIRRGSRLRAKLTFKSWDDINEEMRQALVLFPVADVSGTDDPFDVRNRDHRAFLDQALNELDAEHLISGDALNMNTVLLVSFLRGYDRVKDMIASKATTVTYEDSDFALHQQFVGNDTLSVYLKDVELVINSGDMDETVEIADCQGSDASNPLHLLMIQDYLLVTHLIVYVISSRTGVREADIKFLSIIKKMGIMDHTIFVVNMDINEHESLGDFIAVSDRIKGDLSLLKPEPDVYMISALYNLFRSENYEPSKKDENRLGHWKQDFEMTDFSDRETRRFHRDFSKKLTGERYSILLTNHLERLSVILLSMDHWLSLNRNLLDKDVGSASDIIKKINVHQSKVDKIHSMIKSTMSGALAHERSILRTDVDRFFDNRPGRIFQQTLDFIKTYQVPYEKYESNVTPSTLTQTLYLIYQEFRQDLERFIAERVNPDLIRFIREEENKIREDFKTIFSPYDLMIEDVLKEYNQMLERSGLLPVRIQKNRLRLPDMDVIKQRANLKIPALSALLRYSARIKTETVMHFGLYKVINVLKKIFKRTESQPHSENISALRRGVERLKKETTESTTFHFKDHRENLKFQYLLKAADIYADACLDALMERFQGLSSDLSDMTNLLDNEKIDREHSADIVEKMTTACSGISKKIQQIRQTLDESADHAAS